MKQILTILIIFTSTLIGQDFKISINTSVTTTLSEDIRNAVNYKPVDQHIYFYRADLRFRLLEKIPIYSGISFQFGNKSVSKGLTFLPFSINNVDIEYIQTKREISLSILKIPVIYSFSLNEFVNLYPGFYAGWGQFKLNNKGNLLSDNGDKYSQINDSVIKDKLFLEPLLGLDVIVYQNIYFNFEVSYKNIEHSINSDFEDMEVDIGIIDFATEKYKYKISGFFYTFGLGISI